MTAKRGYPLSRRLLSDLQRSVPPERPRPFTLDGSGGGQVLLACFDRTEAGKHPFQEVCTRALSVGVNPPWQARSL